MTDPKKLAEEAKRLAVEYAASAVYAANDHSLIGESVAASHKLNASIDQLSALAEKAEQAWLPIETAPKDGSYVFVWPPLWNGAIGCACWDEDGFARRPRPFWRRLDDMGRITESRDNQPTHWQPLPVPPAALSTGEPK
jgi:hypothetical protein